MRVWQPGTHLTMERGAEVGDWSWRRTRRRLAELARLTKPYKRRTALSIFFLLLATGTGLLPPALAKFAVDDGIRKHDLTALWWIVGAFVAAGLLNWIAGYAQTYYTGWVGERLGLVTATLAEDIAGMRVVQAFTREDRNIAHFREVNAHYRQANQQTVVLSGLYFPFVDFLSTLALSVVLGYGGWLYFHGET